MIKNIVGSAVKSFIVGSGSEAEDEPYSYMLDDNPLGFWTLNEDYSSDATNLADPGTLDGTIGSAATFETDLDGIFTDGVYGFTGEVVNSMIQIGNDVSVQLTEGTIEAWVNTTDAGSSYRGIFVKQGAFGLFMVNNVLATYDSTAGALRSTGVSIDDGDWHHIAMTFTSGVTNGAKVYLDGVLSLTTRIEVKYTDRSLNIGTGSFGGATERFIGQIARPAIFSSILSPSQILAHSNNPPT